MIKKILVPYDGSSLSKKALELAKDIARNFNADLALFMVIPAYYQINYSTFSVSSKDYKRLINVLKEQAEKKIGSITQRCREEGVKASYKVVSGDVSDAIIKEAKRTGVDLIIMGSRRMTGISTIKRLGSTARHVSEHATSPVTIVH